MEQKIKHRLAWLTLVFAVVIILLMSGCSVFEDQMLKAKGLVGLGGETNIECTSNTETGCEGWVASETTGSTIE